MISARIPSSPSLLAVLAVATLLALPSAPSHAQTWGAARIKGSGIAKTVDGLTVSGSGLNQTVAGSGSIRRAGDAS